MSLKRSKMGIKIHPFCLPLLLINVRNPYKRRTTLLKRCNDFRYE
jgi:hypothetical protein